MSETLPTELWVDALMRRVMVAGASAFVLQRGDAERGVVLLKVSELNGTALLLTQRTNINGVREFIDMALEGLGTDEADTDAYLRRSMARDGDLWAVEIEDRKGRHFLTEEVKLRPPPE